MPLRPYLERDPIHSRSACTWGRASLAPNAHCPAKNETRRIDRHEYLQLPASLPGTNNQLIAHCASTPDSPLARVRTRQRGQKLVTKPFPKKCNSWLSMKEASYRSGFLHRQFLLSKIGRTDLFSGPMGRLCHALRPLDMCHFQAVFF